MPIKRIILLANSRKLSGRCLAGKEVGNQEWIRPVSSREHQEVSEQERGYEDGSDPKVLDVIDVPVIEPRPHLFQQENWLLDERYYWSKVGQKSWDDLLELADEETLWINNQSTYNGLNDRVSLEEAAALDNSLRLVHVEDVELHVFSPGAAFGNSKRRVQGQFTHLGVDYQLWVTDPDYERRFLAKANAVYPLGESFLTISLGEPKDGYCYKLIAAILERDQEE